MEIYFDGGCNFIAASENGGVIIRCPFQFTDCGEDEPLELFVRRKGGEQMTAQYLQGVYAAHTALT